MVPPKQLKRFPIFVAFKKRELEEIIRNSSIKTLTEGEVLFTVNEKRDLFYIVLEGDIAILRELGSVSQPVEIVTKGEYIAEYALFDPKKKHEHSAIAHTKNTRILVLQGKRFKKLTSATRYKLLLNLLPIIADNFSHASNRLITLLEVGKIIGIHNQSVTEMATKILAVVLKAIRAERGLIALRDIDPEKIEIIATCNFDPKNDLSGKILSADEDPIVGSIINSGKEIILGASEYLTSNKKVPYINASVLGMPLTSSATIGAVVLIDKMDSQGFSTNNEVLLNIIAHMITLGLQHAQERAYQRAQQELKQEYISL